MQVNSKLIPEVKKTLLALVQIHYPDSPVFTLEIDDLTGYLKTTCTFYDYSMMEALGQKHFDTGMVDPIGKKLYAYPCMVSELEIVFELMVKEFVGQIIINKLEFNNLLLCQEILKGIIKSAMADHISRSKKDGTYRVGNEMMYQKHFKVPSLFPA